MAGTDTRSPVSTFSGPGENTGGENVVAIEEAIAEALTGFAGTVQTYLGAIFEYFYLPCDSDFSTTLPNSMSMANVCHE